MQPDKFRLDRIKNGRLSAIINLLFNMPGIWHYACEPKTLAIIVIWRFDIITTSFDLWIAWISLCEQINTIVSCENTGAEWSICVTFY